MCKVNAPSTVLHNSSWSEILSVHTWSEFCTPFTPIILMGMKGVAELELQSAMDESLSGSESRKKKLDLYLWTK